jgi:pimeloyl-ACP methyl ester carboxylesterase
MRVEINDAQLCFETFGDAADPAILLIAGSASSMDRWETVFCERLADAGRFVIRYDHRDTGGSTTYPPGKPGYTSDVLFGDPLALIDHLGIERAHLAGISMGGAIAQQIALEHPQRVLSLTLIATSPIGPGERDLPPMSDELRAVFTEEPTEPDWADRDAAIAFLLDVERPYVGSRGLDEDAMRPLIALAYDRSSSPASANNHFVLEGSEPQRPVSEIAAPTLVVHGSDDPLFPLPHGEALAREIPGATLLVIDGMGHEFPRSAWDEVLPALIAHSG